MTDEWRNRAACLGQAPLWDETIGDDVSSESRLARKARHEKAKGICAGCPVGDECLADARVGRDEGIRNQKRLPQLNNGGRYREAS